MIGSSAGLSLLPAAAAMSPVLASAASPHHHHAAPSAAVAAASAVPRSVVASAADVLSYSSVASRSSPTTTPNTKSSVVAPAVDDEDDAPLPPSAAAAATATTDDPSDMPNNRHHHHHHRMAAASLLPSPTPTEDSLGAAAKTINPDHLRNASNEDLMKMMQYLQTLKAANADSPSSDATNNLVNAVASAVQHQHMQNQQQQQQQQQQQYQQQHFEDDCCTHDEQHNHLNHQMQLQMQLSDKSSSFTGAVGDMRRQSVSLPITFESEFVVDRRGSLGALPSASGFFGPTASTNTPSSVVVDDAMVTSPHRGSLSSSSIFGHGLDHHITRMPRDRLDATAAASADSSSADDNNASGGASAQVSFDPAVGRERRNSDGIQQQQQQQHQGSPPQTQPSSPKFDQRVFRLEVETTLHRTLELDCMLTLKELHSFEAHAAAADLEYSRARKALEDAQMAVRDRQAELELAIQERSEVQSIIRYLAARVDSLNARIRDGSSVIASLRSGSGSAPLSAGVGVSSASSASSVATATAVDTVLSAGIISASVTARRHSSPGLTTITPSNTPPRTMPLSIISSIDRDMDEWTRRTEDQAEEDRLYSKTDPDGGISSSASSVVNANANLKRARTTSPADGDDILSSSSRHHLNASDMCISSTTPSGGSVIAMKDVHSSVSSPQDSSYTAASADLLRPPPACVPYQRGQCMLSARECGSVHVCIRCGGPHPVILCKKDRNVCVKWNMEECTSACHREHRCLRCASRDHTLRTCPIRPLGGAEFCFAWNSAGTCRIVDCRRLHDCIRCGTSHPSIICPENLDNYLYEYIKRRRAEGLMDEDLLRLEVQLSHSLASVSAPTTGNPPNNGIQQQQLAAALQQQQQVQVQQQQQQQSLQAFPQLVHPGSMLGVGMVQPHPMHLAAAAAAAASLRGITSTPQHQLAHQHVLQLAAVSQHQQQMNQQQQSLVVGQNPMLLAAALDMERASKRLRPDDPHAAVLSGFRGVNGSLLSDAERKTICRDYNNFKCEVEDNRCRFRHACLRCGLPDHRERNCTIFDTPY